MSPLHCEENIKQSENCYWYSDEKRGHWTPVIRRSSFSDINQIVLSIARNSRNSGGYPKEFQRYMRNEKKRLARLERQGCWNENVIISILLWIWRHTFERIREDWLCLALLGIFMALLSVGVDKGIELCSNGKVSIES